VHLFRKRHGDAAEPPLFRMVAVGPEGGGKSILLSTLFHQLSLPDPARAYRLDADLEHSAALSEIYEQVCDTSRGWPLGTNRGTMQEYVFDCVASGGHDPIMRINWVDYPGELLQPGTDISRESRVELETRVRKAHAVMAIVDGRRIRQLLRGEPDGARYFEATVRPMFLLLGKASGPIHLVLTKWDLVRDYGESASATEQARLADVIAALSEFRHIRTLVRERHGRVVRLIPVSAVGPAFADLDATGRVVKRRDGRLEPVNVDVPLCSFLPDLFKQILAAQEEAQRDDIDKEARRRLRRDTAVWLASLGLVARRPTRLVLNWALAPLWPVGGPLTELLDTWATNNGTQILQAHAARTARDAETTRMRSDVIREFETRVHQFEETFPNCRLNSVWGAA
jgi:hypothetical protein